ncbi:MAG: hypothetical protein ACFFBD_02745 [Candidatus Hodarchaeota archaeon]
MFQTIKSGTKNIYCHLCGCSNLGLSKFCVECGTPLRHDVRRPPSPVFPYYQRTTDQESFRQKPSLSELSLATTMRNGFDLFTNNPKLWWITGIVSIVDIFLILLFFIISSFPIYYNSYLSLSVVIYGYLLTALISFVVTNFFSSWILTSYKQIRSRIPLSLSASFGEALSYFPKILGASGLVILAEILLFGSGYVVLSLFTSYTPYYFFIGLIGVIAVMFVFQLFFTYVSQNIILGEKNIIESLRQSWKFTNKYFWVTLGTTVVLCLFSASLSFMIYIAPLALKIMQTVAILAFARVYDDYEYTIKEKRPKSQYYRYQYYSRPY